MSGLGYLVPRSMLLRKMMEMAAFSAKMAWVKFLRVRKNLIFFSKVAFIACPSMPHIPYNLLYFKYK
jgi:hypothetical protein